MRSLKKQVVSGDGYAVTVHQATVDISLTRQRLQEEAQRDDETLDFNRRMLRLFTYPDCLACSQPLRGFEEWPIGFDEWLALPEAFVERWDPVVYRLNPHWQPAGGREEQAKADANELQRRLIAAFKKRKENQNAELPDTVYLNDLETSYKVFLRMEATGWRHLPSAVLSEPDWLFDDLLTIRSEWSIVERMLTTK